MYDKYPWTEQENEKKIYYKMLKYVDRLLRLK